MTLFLYIRLFINHHDYTSIMSHYLKHRVIRVMKIVKRIKNPFDCFRVIRRLLEIKNKSKYCLHVTFKFKKEE